MQKKARRVGRAFQGGILPGRTAPLQPRRFVRKSRPDQWDQPVGIIGGIGRLHPGRIARPMLEAPDPGAAMVGQRFGGMQADAPAPAHSGCQRLGRIIARNRLFDLSDDARREITARAPPITGPVARKLRQACGLCRPAQCRKWIWSRWSGQ
jgi:hypothetical protein